ncbi:MAG: hypothetical protein ACE5E5_10285 [Phycisphaerae bacterium]
MLMSAWLVVVSSMGGGTARAQTPDDDVIDKIRGLASIPTPDQDRVDRWLRAKVEGIRRSGQPIPAEGFATVFADFKSNFQRSGDSDEFNALLASKLAEIAAAELSQGEASPVLAFALPRMMVELNRMETVPGLLGGLKAKSAVARLICAQGLAKLRSAIAASGEQLPDVVAALRAAGLAEQEPVVLARIYLALAYPANSVDVESAYLDIFDKRLAFRRGPAELADGAEVEAFEYFRTSGVLDQLNEEQQAALVKRLAVFLRLDAQRYNDGRLAPPKDGNSVDFAFSERDVLERMLIANEAILARVTKSSNRTITTELGGGGWKRRQAVLNAAYGWIGDPVTSTTGVLNAAPFGVELGAP